MVSSSTQIGYLIRAKECLDYVDLESFLNSKKDVTSSAIEQIKKDVEIYIKKEKELKFKIEKIISEIKRATFEVNQELQLEAKNNSISIN